MKKLWFLIIWQVFNSFMIWGQTNAPAPARVVTSYALTWVREFTIGLPSAWRLLASNDGQTWIELDVQTNQPTANAARRTFRVANKKAFRIYRLQVDANASNEYRGASFAEIELMGPVVGVEQESDLRANITSSQEHPLLGAAVNAFDADPATTWLDYAPLQAGGCWIQCAYVRQSELLMTNVNAVRIGTILTATPTLLTEKSPQILSNLTTSTFRPSRTLTGYALTSANDIPVRDPSDWQLIGSNDGGKTWETVDVRRGETFSSRLHRRVFQLARPVNFTRYRLLMVTKTASNSIQLAEVEPLYADQQENSNFSLVISAFGENPPMEKTEMAFDHDSRSKWLCFYDSSTTNIWIQWQCLPKVEGLPLINLEQFNRLLNRSAKANPVPPISHLTRVLTNYTLISGNDFPERDPSDWRLLGSNDKGETWETLDVRHAEKFSERFQKRTFTLAKPRPYSVYKLVFETVLTPTNANSIQLAEVAPAYSNDQAQFSLVISAGGDNLPLEGIEKLFDGDPQTKWLDYTDNTRRASWVQWYFAAQEKTPLIRADAVTPIQPGFPQMLKLQLDGVVVWADSESLGFLDQSGFQMFQLESPVPEVKPGDRVRLTGRLRFGKEFPLVTESHWVDLGPLTNRSTMLQPGQFSDDKQPYVVGAAEGRVVAVSDGQLYSTLRLSPENGTRNLLVKVLNPRHLPLPVFADHKIQIHGVIESAFDEEGQRRASVIWVASLKDITVTAPAEAARPVDRMPETTELTTLHQINEACKNQPESMFNVKVRGVVTFVDLGLLNWYLQNGPDAVVVHAQVASGLSPYLKQEGMYVEIQGTIGGASGFDIEPSGFAKVLGKGRMPEPLRPSMDSLIAGNCDNKWVQMEGVVVALEKQRLTLSVNGGRLVAWVNEADLKGQDRLLGSLVRVSGVCSPILNNRQQHLGVRLLVPSADWIEMIDASPENPFAMPTRELASLLQANPRGAGQRTPLRKITGIVTYREPQMLFVQNSNDAVRVFPRDDVMVNPGDKVEVVGMAEPDGLTPKLVQALIRKTGHTSLPAANPIDVQGMTLDDDNSSKDATRGRVQATLVGLDANESVQILELQQEGTKTPFRAYLSRDPGRPFTLPTGTRLQLEGAFKTKSDTVPDFGQVVSSFEMYLNSQSDIVVLERPPWWTPRHTLWSLSGLGLVLFAALTWISSLRTQVRRRTRELHAVITQHEQTEEQLQAEISERKRMEIEVQKTHKALVDASRQAGMAEVAISVLHNVGNVLNSVNVAAGIIADNIRKSSSAKLAKVAALINEHAGNLGTFLASDPKGQRIPSYLTQLAAHLDKEQSTTLGEVEGLRQNIEHIKEIVARQQTHARAVGVTEIVNVSDLIEEALRADGVLNCPDIKIIRETDRQISNLTVNKHKVLQILVNLIRNAKHACDESNSLEKRITLRIHGENQRACISIGDNGVGILPENLTKIFQHGFTTRKNGHGFGLHGSALAAKEMGGALTVQSPGPGLGATFTLKLPLLPPQAMETARKVS